MNNINPIFLLTDIKLNVAYPYLFFILIPAIILALIPYFRLGKRRHTRNRVTSLVLHIIILALATLLLSGVSMEGLELVNNETIIVMDVSDSTRNNNEEMHKYLGNLISSIDPKTNVGLVTYGTNSEYSVKLTKDKRSFMSLYEESYKAKSFSTNVEDAICYAISCFSKNNVKKRIIVISDAMETDGSILNTIDLANNKEVQIDGVFFTPEAYDTTNEAEITGMTLPDSIVPFQNLSIDVNIKAHNGVEGKIKLYDNGTVVVTERIELLAGDNTINLNYQFTEAGMHNLKVEYICDGDIVNENNYYYTFVDISSDQKILIIDGNKDGALMASNVLSSSFEVNVVTPENAPTTVSELTKYGEVILINTDYGLLPPSYDYVLDQYVNVYGGSLLTTGGANTYLEGGMLNTKLNEMLPVEIEAKADNPKAIVIVLDASHSMIMSENNLPGSQKLLMDIAKDGIRNSINSAINSYDYVGIITFWKTATTICELTPATHKEELLSAVDKISGTTKGGTIYDQAIKNAAAMLKSFNGDVMSKHILFVADGDESTKTSEEYKTVIQNLYEEDHITTSSIALGAGVKSTNVAQIAALGHGNSYQVSREDQFANYVYQECLSQASPSLNNSGTYTSYVKNITSATKEVDFANISKISGYNGTSIKKGATEVLRVINDNGNHDPLYAYWTYGNGKVSSITTDINSWSNYLTSDDGKNLFRNIVADNYINLSMNKQSDIMISTEMVGSQTKIIATTDSDGGKYYTKLKITLPNGEVVSEAMNQINESEFYTIFDSNVGGIYKIDCLKMYEENDKTYLKSEAVSYMAYSYSSEYETFIDSKTLLTDFANVCQKTGGKLYSKEDNISSSVVSEQYIKTEVNIDIPIITVILILFLLDIIVRKFNFLWPHEIISGKKKHFEE